MASYLETRYLAPTNTRGARIKVMGAGSRITLGIYDYDYSRGDGSHRAAIELERRGYLIECAFPTAHGYVWRVADPALEGGE